MHSGYPTMAYTSAASEVLRADYGEYIDYQWGLLHEIGHNHQVSGLAAVVIGSIQSSLQLRALQPLLLRSQPCHLPLPSPRIHAPTHPLIAIDRLEPPRQIGAMTIPATGEVTCNLWSLMGIEGVGKANRTARYGNRRAQVESYWATGSYPSNFPADVGMHMYMSLMEGVAPGDPKSGWVSCLTANYHISLQVDFPIGCFSP